MQIDNQIKVWDPLVRFFHWGVAAGFFVAYATEEDFLSLHTWAGYSVLGLVLLRIVWGVVGTRYARFSSFVFTPRTIRQFIQQTLRLRAKRYLGHNPAGGAMVMLLLVSLLATSVSGLAIYAAEDNAGPLAAWLSGVGEFWVDVLEEIHEFFANFTLLLVVVHVVGVLFESLIHHENLIGAMFSGYKRTEPSQPSREELS
jgi:cytochrome b